MNNTIKSPIKKNTNQNAVELLRKQMVEAKNRRMSGNNINTNNQQLDIQLSTLNKELNIVYNIIID